MNRCKLKKKIPIPGRLDQISGSVVCVGDENKKEITPIVIIGHYKKRQILDVGLQAPKTLKQHHFPFYLYTCTEYFIYLFDFFLTE